MNLKVNEPLPYEIHSADVPLTTNPADIPDDIDDEPRRMKRTISGNLRSNTVYVEQAWAVLGALIGMGCLNVNFADEMWAENIKFMVTTAAKAIADTE